MQQSNVYINNDEIPPEGGFFIADCICGGVFAALTTGTVMIGISVFLPVFVQGVMGRTPMVAGFTLGMMSVGCHGLQPVYEIVGKYAVEQK